MLGSRCRNFALSITFLLLPSARILADSLPIGFDPPLVPGSAAFDQRWLGRKTPGGGPCPEPSPGDPTWRTESLFAPLPANGGVLVVPPALADFCLYQSDGMVAGTDLARLKALFTNGLLLELEPDLLAVSAASPGLLASRLWPALRDQLDEQAGRSPLGIGGGAVPVRLAVLDTEPTGPHKTPLFRGRSAHGYTLLAMAEHLLCAGLGPGSRCPAFLTARLGLPFYRDGDGVIVHDEVGGGELGSLASLARAVQAEAKEWSLHALEGQHLVLNLSLGWDRRYGGWQPSPGDMPLAMRAVLRALEDARCRGALIVAAAGNHIGGPAAPEADGPWFPGGWERQAALDHSACEAALGVALDPSHFPAANAYTPLVYAAAGLQGDGAPLTNASPTSAPRLAAFADHAVVEGHQPGQPTAILTGSSVAALLTSAAAAAVWSQLPALGPAQVMDLLYAAGDPLGRQADVCLAGPEGVGCAPHGQGYEARRISLCTALHQACSEPLAACVQAPPTCMPWRPAEPDVEMAFLAFAAQTPARESAILLTAPYPAAPPCGTWDLSFDPDAGKPLDPCPHRQYRTAEARPWIRPAPESVPCSTCAICLSTLELLIEIDPVFAGRLSHPTLEICGTSYSLPLTELTPGSRVLIEQLQLSTTSPPSTPPPIPPPTSCPMTLSFTVDDRISVLNPLLVVP